jgi:N-acyl-D-aspartate/D-glutamate deacylase
LREGATADVVVFDPEAVVDRATYDDPHRYPDGMPFVIVNGEVAVDRGEGTAARAGRFLRRGVDTA